VEETLVVLQAAGSAFGATLEADDSVDVAPGALLYADPGIELELVSQPLGAEMQALTMVRCGGPGRIGIQSLVAP
jgi:hypothetical protein